MDAPAGAAAASAAAAPPRAAGEPPFAKVFVDEFLRAHDSKVRGSTTRAAALDAGALAALAAAPWQLLLIVGPTASGKTLALAQLSEACALLPDRSADFEFSRDRAVVSHFGSPDAAVLRLGLVGFSDVRKWMQPKHTLSNGQQLRVRVALALQSNATIEDLGASVEPRVACSVAAGVGRLVRAKAMHRVVITTAHPGLIPWLGPDVVLFMPSGTVCFNPVAVTPLNPKARRPVISLRYDDTRFDSGRLPPAVEHAVLAAQRGVVRETLTSRVQQDAATAYAARVFELPFDGLCTVHLSPSPDVPPASSWRIGALLGPSGCGKSTHLAAIAASWEPAAMPGEVRVESFTPEPSSWPADLCVLSHLCLALGPLPDGTTTAATRFARQTAAAARLPRVTSALAAAGLRKEAWQLPFSSLSSGEQELAALAYALITPDETALTLIVADEFTSALDDSTAYATAVRLAAYVRTQPHLRLLVAGVRDVRDWLRPDWAYDVPAGRLDLFAAGAPAAPAPPAAQPPPGDGDVAAVAALFKPPTVSIVVRSLPSGIAVKNRHLLSNGSGALWEHVFKNQHYLVGDVSNASTVFIGRLDEGGGVDGEPIGFVAVAPSPGKLPDDDDRPRLRESRLVIEQTMQGLGIGPLMSLLVANQVCLYGKNGAAGGHGAAAGGSSGLSGAGSAAGKAPNRYLAVTALESLAGARDRDDKNWKRQKTDGGKKSGKQTNLGFDQNDKEKAGGKQERTTYHHEYIGSDRPAVKHTQQRSVKAMFAAKAPALPPPLPQAAAQAGAASGSGAGAKQPAVASKWQAAPVPPMLLPPPPVAAAAVSLVTPAGAGQPPIAPAAQTQMTAALASGGGLARAADGSDDAPKRARRKLST